MLKVDIFLFAPTIESRICIQTSWWLPMITHFYTHTHTHTHWCSMRVNSTTTNKSRNTSFPDVLAKLFLSFSFPLNLKELNRKVTDGENERKRWGASHDRRLTVAAVAVKTSDRQRHTTSSRLDDRGPSEIIDGKRRVVV